MSLIDSLSSMEYTHFYDLRDAYGREFAERALSRVVDGTHEAFTGLWLTRDIESYQPAMSYQRPEQSNRMFWETDEKSTNRRSRLARLLDALSSTYPED